MAHIMEAEQFYYLVVPTEKKKVKLTEFYSQYSSRKTFWYYEFAIHYCPFSYSQREKTYLIENNNILFSHEAWFFSCPNSFSHNHEELLDI